MLEFTIQVTNVDEDGDIILGSAHPQANIRIVATLTDPDGVDLADGNQVNWVVERSPDSNTWTEISDPDTSSVRFRYTPVADDAGKTLRFKATYKDGYDSVTVKTIDVETENAVLSAPPSNLPPTFDDSAPESLSVSEDAAVGTNIGAPIPATDPDGDTLTFAIAHSSVDMFDITTGGQVFLSSNSSLDYEIAQTYNIWIWTRDSKDYLGEADTAWDANHLVAIYVTNAEEAGSVHLSTNSPEVDVELSARLDDPDRLTGILTWQWQIADSNPSDAWTDITGATSESYTPTLSDIDKFLRAKVSYDDDESTGQEAFGTATDAVRHPDNESPEFDEGETATRSVSENAAAGTRISAAVTALDPEGDTLAYSLASGTDADKFSIDAATGRMEVASGADLDFESDSSLEVTLQESDGKAADHSQDDSVDDTISVTIELVNVDEPGEVALSSGEPIVGKSLTATLTDIDGGTTGTSWHWGKSQGGATSWEAINGSSSETYMPASSDAGMYLRAMVDYSDGEGSSKSAEGMSAATFKALPVDTTLASLTPGGIPFTFSGNTLEYDLSVPNSKKCTKVMATATASSGVSVEITPSDSKPNKNGHQVNLAVGVTQITITVSEDQGSGSTTYTLQVTREAPETQDPPQP